MRKQCRQAAARGAGWLSAALLLVACSFDNTGLDYAQLSISAVTPDGGAASAPSTASCTVLPVLIGSVVEEEYALSSALGVRVHATRDAAHLSFIGARDGALHERTISARQLEQDYRESFDLTDGAGQTLRVMLDSACAAE